MKARFLSISIVLFYFIINQSIAQDIQKLVLIQPTGQQIKDFPEMTIVPDTSEVCRFVDSVAGQTFVGEAVKLYYLASRYLYNIGELDHIEPAYLAITPNQGGFAREGFYLKEIDGTSEDKSDVPYIDLTLRNITAPLEQLESLTQLYPHELMHAVFKMLSSGDSVEMTSYNVNMHYFSLLTDYNTAFNEGFSEHMEVVAVLHEPTEWIKEGKQESADKLKPRLEQRIGGFERDYRWPVRLEYYKASMITWYQQFENYKRFVHAKQGNAALMNDYPELGHPRDMITFRNSGVEQRQGHYKNLVQRMSCEGYVSTFFTRLAQSDLPERYRPASFYKDFLADTSITFVPQNLFTPLQNQFIKYFFILHKYVNYEFSEKAQLIDFIEGYCKEFPDEAGIVLKIYHDLAGEDYDNNLPAHLWLMAKGYKHPVLVMDPYGATSVPVYTVDLNAAEIPDLMTIKGMDRASAGKVINYRDQNGFIKSFEELKDIPGLDKSTVDLLLGSQLDKDYFNSIPEDNVDITAVIITPLLHLLKRGMILFVLVGLVVYVLFRKLKNPKQMIFKIARTLGTWLLMIIAGLASVVMADNPLLFISGICLVYLLIVWLVNRKKKDLLIRNGIIALLITGLIVYSII